MKEVLGQIRKELIRAKDEGIRKSTQAFFKEQVKAYGVKTPVVKEIAKRVLPELKKEGKEYIFRLCEDLWRSGYIEESIMASEWAYSQRKLFEAVDFELFKHWVSSYVNNWASCDTFCNVIGEFLLKYPEYTPRLKDWAKDENRWLRRAAAVSFVLPARKGKYLKEILKIAQLQLEDEDDMVQKGYGWMLKVASKEYEKEVFDFVMKNKTRMPRTALRYAIEKMPAALKAKAMAK